MGLFLQTAILPRCGEETARSAVTALAQRDGSLELDVSGCRFIPSDKGMQILFNDSCAGYDSLSGGLSELTGGPVMLLYIYDEDFWGYFYCENGKELDRFTPMPDYFGEVEDPEPSGNSALIAERFGVPEEVVARYLVTWTDGDFEGARKASPDEEFPVGDCWQMADFMAKLGWPYPD
ncbi:MAG: hypothetical protein K2K53_05295 [Oscillospiraceae bacterium]|nr:hypothetical protein [Oscillospiraceae bacterium]